MIWDILTFISLALSIMAIIMSFYFWRNPISSDIKNKKIYKSSEEVYFHYGYNNVGWVVEKRDVNDVLTGKAFKFIADRKNNRKIRKLPTITEFENLNYREK